MLSISIAKSAIQNLKKQKGYVVAMALLFFARSNPQHDEEIASSEKANALLATTLFLSSEAKHLYDYLRDPSLSLT
jgi:hypothetical protein